MILDRLERISVEAWREDRHDPPEVVYHLGHLWLRIHAQTVDMHRARASALWSRMARAAPRSWLTRALDVVLHGAVGAGRSAETLAPGVKNPRFFTHVTDDPGTVVRCIRKAGLGDRYWVPDARLAFLGGEEVIHAFARSWRGMKTGAQQRLFVETAGFIRSPFIDRMLEEMSVSSRARRAAKAMLARRRAPT